MHKNATPLIKIERIGFSKLIYSYLHFRDPIDLYTIRKLIFHPTEITYYYRDTKNRRGSAVGAKIDLKCNLVPLDCIKTVQELKKTVGKFKFELPVAFICNADNSFVVEGCVFM